MALLHHHEVLRLPLLLVAGASVRVQLVSLPHKVLPVRPAGLTQRIRRQTMDVCNF